MQLIPRIHLYVICVANLTPLEQESVGTQKNKTCMALGVLIYYFLLGVITLILRSFTEDEKAQVNTL